MILVSLCINVLICDQLTSSSDGSVKWLRFSALPWGCETYDCITLVNRGQSNIPVRLVISSVCCLMPC